MARQQIRAVIQAPQDNFTNFSKGIENNTHTKDTSNPRVQLIKNMETTSDGKLAVRRPLIPYKFNTKDWGEGFITPTGFEVIKLIHAPFSKLQTKFMWLVRPTADSNLSNTDVRLYYLENGELIRQNYISNGKDILSPLTFLSGSEIQYFFRTSEDALYIQVPEVGLVKVSLAAVNTVSTDDDVLVSTVFSITRPLIYYPSATEITEVGLNLYLDHPYYIHNVSFTSEGVILAGIFPYAWSNSGGPLNEDELSFLVYYNGTSRVIYKAMVDVSRSVLQRAVNELYDIQGRIKYDFPGTIGDTPPATVWDNKVKSFTYASDGSTTSTEENFTLKSLLLKISPTMHWRSKLVTDTTDAWSGAVKTGGTTEATPMLPLIFGAGDSNISAEITEIGRARFNDKKWEFNPNVFGKLINVDYRPDVYVVPKQEVESTRAYKIDIAYDTNSILNSKGFKWVNLLDKVAGQSFGAATQDGFTIGDANITEWANTGYKNTWEDNNQFHKTAGTPIPFNRFKDALNPEMDYSLVLSDCYVPREDTKWGFHKLTFRFDPNNIYGGIRLTTPVTGDIGSGFIVNSEQLQINRVKSWDDPNKLGIASDNFIRFKGGN